MARIGSESIRLFHGLVVFSLAVLLCVVTAEPGWTGTRQEDQLRAQRGLAIVDSLLQRGHGTEAVLVCQELLHTLSNDLIYGWQIEGRLGVALLVSQQPAAAVPYLAAVAQREPRESIHHRNLGAALVQLNRRGRALSEYRVAVELAPSKADLRREYGQMLLSFGDTKNAAYHLHVALRLCDGCADLDEPLIALYLAQGNDPAAVTILERLYQKDRSAELRQRLLTAMSRAADDSALVLFIVAIDELERTADEWRLLIEAEGRCSSDMIESQMMVARLSEAGASSLPSAVAEDHRFWGQVALNLLAHDKFAAGLRAVDQALLIAPEDVVYLNNRVVMLTKLGRHDEARVAWDRVLAVDPSLAEEAR